MENGDVRIICKMFVKGTLVFNRVLYFDPYWGALHEYGAIQIYKELEGKRIEGEVIVNIIFDDPKKLGISYEPIEFPILVGIPFNLEEKEKIRKQVETSINNKLIPV